MTTVYFMMGMLTLGGIGCVLLGVMLHKIVILQRQTNGMLATLKVVAYKEGHDAAERGEP